MNVQKPVAFLAANLLRLNADWDLKMGPESVALLLHVFLDQVFISKPIKVRMGRVNLFIEFSKYVFKEDLLQKSSQNSSGKAGKPPSNWRGLILAVGPFFKGTYYIASAIEAWG